MAIHPQAIVDPRAEVHEDAEIGPFCIVADKVRIEAGVELKNSVTVYGRTTIGARTRVFPGAVIGGDPQSLGYDGEDTSVVIGSDCVIHEYVTVNKGTARGLMETRIGNNCMIMAYAHVAHDCVLEDHVILGNNTQLAGHVKVGRKAIISGMTGVHHFVTVGELAFIGAMSGLRMDVPPFLTYDGVPAEPRNVNIVGMRRDGWQEGEIRDLKHTFRLMYHDRCGRPMADLLEELPGMPFGNSRAVQRLHGWLELHLSNNRKGRLQEAFR